MFEKIWYGRSKWYWLLLPLSYLYGTIVFIRGWAYRRGLLRSWRAPVPIVVVGNITVGGSGKTPFVIWLVEKLSAQGIKVGVVSRGYGGSAPNYPLLVVQTSSPQEVGDEPILIFRRTGIPVVVDPQRVRAVQALLKHHKVDLVITDDGLQHYALQRDMEILVVDAVRQFGNQQLLPAGPLRETVARLSSVDLVVNNGTNNSLEQISMQLIPAQAVNLVTGKSHPINQLNKIVAIAGIGHPQRFFITLANQGAKLVEQIAFSDHYIYSQKELLTLCKQDQVLLMTEKDAVKCFSFAQANWWYLPVDAHLSMKDSSLILHKILVLLRK